MEFLGGMRVTCLILYESAQLFSRVPTPFLIPVNNVYKSSQVEVVKNPSANAGRHKRHRLDPGLNNSLEEEMAAGFSILAWWATISC